MKKTEEKIIFPGFFAEREVKSSPRGSVLFVRSETSTGRFVYRSFPGTGEVYRKLLDVDCPYLPKIYEVREEDGWTYVLEEYIQGDTLAFLLEGRPLSPTHARQIILHLCRALTELHGIGAVHRDIKPENIILRGGDAVLIDFDASRLRKTERATDTQIMGTTGYAAPEQYGFSQTDQRTDIYSLGILLNEMLTGQHPSRCLAEGEFRPIIEKCTRINAAQRYSSTAELARALKAVSGSKIHRKLLIPLLAIFLLPALWLIPRFWAERAVSTEPSSAEMTEVSQPTELSLPPAKLATPAGRCIAEEPWEGDTTGYVTDFNCDMDGDGVEEYYRFGICMHNMPYVPHSYYDRCDSGPGVSHVRTPHVCVWKISEDGAMVEALDFAKLLTDVELTIYRVDDLESPNPSIHAEPHTWPGYTLVTFRPSQSGTWLYEAKAKFGDLELTGIYTSSFVYIEN